jgi:hypothetical protein
MSTFLADARQTVAPSRNARDGLLPPLLVALAGALLVLRVHIVYPLVIAP